MPPLAHLLSLRTRDPQQLNDNIAAGLGATRWSTSPSIGFRLILSNTLAPLGESNTLVAVTVLLDGIESSTLQAVEQLVTLELADQARVIEPQPQVLGLVSLPNRRVGGTLFGTCSWWPAEEITPSQYRHHVSARQAFLPVRRGLYSGQLLHLGLWLPRTVKAKSDGGLLVIELWQTPEVVKFNRGVRRSFEEQFAGAVLPQTPHGSSADIVGLGTHEVDYLSNR